MNKGASFSRSDFKDYSGRVASYVRLTSQEEQEFGMDREASQKRISNYIEQRSRANGEASSFNLLIRLEQRKKRALEQWFVDRNMNLAFWAAGRYCFSHPHLDESEVFSSAEEALWKAVLGFDYRFGFRFSTYAMNAIKNEFSRLAEAHKRKINRYFYIEEINPKDLVFIDVDRLSGPEVRRVVERAIERIEQERERVILRNHLGFNTSQRRLTLREISQLLGVSRQRVSQIQRKALENLRADEEVASLGLAYGIVS